MNWNWRQPDPEGAEHAHAWWAESEPWHLTVCADGASGGFRWVVCTSEGTLRAGGGAPSLAAARQAAEDAAEAAGR